MVQRTGEWVFPTFVVTILLLLAFGFLCRYTYDLFIQLENLQVENKQYYQDKEKSHQLAVEAQARLNELDSETSSLKQQAQSYANAYEAELQAKEAATNRANALEGENLFLRQQLQIALDTAKTERGLKEVAVAEIVYLQSETCQLDENIQSQKLSSQQAEGEADKLEETNRKMEEILPDEQTARERIQNENYWLKMRTKAHESLLGIYNRIQGLQDEQIEIIFFSIFLINVSLMTIGVWLLKNKRNLRLRAVAL